MAAGEGSLQKANMLIGAMFAQLIAVLLLGWAVWLILQMPQEAAGVSGGPPGTLVVHGPRIFRTRFVTPSLVSPIV